MTFYPAAKVPAAGDADRVRAVLLGADGRGPVLHDQVQGLREIRHIYDLNLMRLNELNHLP